jgi:hypothetical protein
MLISISRKRREEGVRTFWNKIQLGVCEDVTDAPHKITLYSVVKYTPKFVPQLENKKILCYDYYTIKIGRTSLE